jgi:hypothetical protein
MTKGSSAARPTVHSGYTLVRIVDTGKEISITIYAVFYASDI